MHFDAPNWLRALWLVPLVLATAGLGRAIPTRLYRFVSGAARALMATLIVLALAQPVIERQQAQATPGQLIILRDASASVAPETDRVRALANRFATACGSERPCAVFVFGADVALGENDAVESGTTDIEVALDAAVARLGSARGHVLEPIPKPDICGVRMILHVDPQGRTTRLVAGTDS